uniref:Uncharacterized protein n=1 Tax=viral metagenome TaxID=1070528 RepID=A0A6C0KW73_9ZZZZ
MFYAQSLYDESPELSDEIVLPSVLFQQIIQQFDNESVLYVNLINTENNIQYLVTLTASHRDDNYTIYVPSWILDIIGNSEDSIYDIEKANVDDLPIAQRIVIKPLDPRAFDMDLTTYFEMAFMNLHSIQEQITIPMDLFEFPLFAYICHVEPAPLCRIVHGEVQVEFINDFCEEQDSQPQERPATPIPPSAEERAREIRESWIRRFQ